MKTNYVYNLVYKLAATFLVMLPLLVCIVATTILMYNQTNNWGWMFILTIIIGTATKIGDLFEN